MARLAELKLPGPTILIVILTIDINHDNNDHGSTDRNISCNRDNNSSRKNVKNSKSTKTSMNSGKNQNDRSTDPWE